MGIKRLIGKKSEERRQKARVHPNVAPIISRRDREDRGDKGDKGDRGDKGDSNEKKIYSCKKGILPKAEGKNSDTFGSFLRLNSSLTLTFLGILVFPDLASAQTANVDIVVNSNQDTIQPDEFVTLREAIEIVNGTLPLNQLSQAEQKLVLRHSSSVITHLQAKNTKQDPTTNNQPPTTITFNLPVQETTIKLTSALPAISNPDVIIDGTTQPGYDTSKVPSGAIPIVTPVVGITPAEGYKISRGFTIVSDRVTIRGLRIYGFTADHNATTQTPPADIFISHPLPPPDISQQKIPNAEAPFYESNIPPKDIVIEDNLLGIAPAEWRVGSEEEDAATNNQQPTTNNQSAFGVYVFNSNGVTIVRNAIAYHQGSGIITSVRANNLVINENLIERNGFAGMPDAIRLEGEIQNSVITANLIQNNAGSAIFAFKPTGAVTIQGNVITDNGQRFKRSAIYLMGSDHQVTNNQIMNQPGPGVVVAAFPKSDRVFIENNQFSNLQGLSIDLVAQFNTNVQDYQQGDGPNPPITHYQQRRQAANFGINAPRFISLSSGTDTNTIILGGEAPKDSQVQVYRVTETTGIQGPLNQVIATVEADEEGKFSITLEDLKAGDKVSAIATHPEYGTSEPAENVVIRPLVSNGSTP